MGFYMGFIQHKRLEIGVFLRQSIENPLKNAGPGPTFIAIIKRLGRAVFGRNI